jgi:hypothetical protein
MMARKQTYMIKDSICYDFDTGRIACLDHGLELGAITTLASYVIRNRLVIRPPLVTFEGGIIINPVQVGY